MIADLSGQAVMAIEWTLFGLAYIMVGLRIGVRVARKQQKQVLISDVFLVFSALDCLGLIICDTWTHSVGGMSLTGEASTMTQETVLNKLSFASNYFYDTGMYFPKATLLALYFKLIPATMPRSRTMLYIVSGYTLSCAISTFLLDTFYCHHIADNWSLDEGACSSFKSTLVFQVDWALNVSSDVLIFVLPFPLLQNLHLQRKQLYGLWATFALGIITMCVSLGRFLSIQLGSSWNAFYVWSMAEMTVAIIVVSLPALKTLVKSHRKGSTSLSGSRSNAYYANDNRHKLPSRVESHKIGTLVDDTGSDVELNHVASLDAIYKTKEISIDSQPVESEEISNDAEPWNDHEFRYYPSRRDV